MECFDSTSLINFIKIARGFLTLINIWGFIYLKMQIVNCEAKIELFQITNPYHQCQRMCIDCNICIGSHWLAHYFLFHLSTPSATSCSGYKSKRVEETMTNIEQYLQYFGLEAAFYSLLPVWGSPVFGFGLQLSIEHTQVKGDQWNFYEHDFSASALLTF